MKRFQVMTLATMMVAGAAFSQQPPRINSLVGTIVSEISTQRLRSTVETLTAFGTRHTLSDTVSNTRGVGAARRWIFSEFQQAAASSRGRMEVTFDEFDIPSSGRIKRSVRAANVVATLRPEGHGQNDRMLVIGGHYDSRAGNPMDSTSEAPGANDDGSGTAVVLEAARVLAPYQFDATIVFIAFVGEEQGLFGSTHWSEQARQNGWNVEAMLNNDIVGSTTGGDGSVERSYVRLFSEAYTQADSGSVFRIRNALGLENDGPSRSLARIIQEMASRYVPGFGVKLIYRRDRFLRGGDQSPFHDRGFAAVRFTVALENYDWQHQNVRTDSAKEYGDRVQFMDFDYCASVARINVAVLATLALAPRPPSGAALAVSSLEYTTTLRWDHNPENDLAGYIIRYRDTTSPEWQHAIFTPDTTITVPVLKDDVVFGIQSVDRDGNTSVVSLPRPMR